MILHKFLRNKLSEETMPLIRKAEIIKRKKKVIRKLLSLRLLLHNAEKIYVIHPSVRENPKQPIPQIIVVSPVVASSFVENSICWEYKDGEKYVVSPAKISELQDKFFCTSEPFI